MAQKKAHEVDAWLARPGATVPIVLLYGPDRGLVSERASLIASRLGLPPDDPFSIVKLDASELEADPGRLSSEVDTLPMFSDRRLVWIRNAGAHKQVGEEVLRLCKDGMPDTCTLLIEAGELRKTVPLRTAVEAGANAMALPCYADEGRAIEALIDDELARAGLSISREARALLMDNLGGDRLASRRELEKLVLYCLGRERVEEEDIRLLTGDVSGGSADDTIDAMLAGNIAEVDRSYGRLLVAGNHPFVALSAALRSFQQLEGLRARMDAERKAASAIVASARPPIFFSRRRLFETALHHWPQQALSRALERLQAAILATRERPELAGESGRQALLALAVEASRLKG